LREINLGEWESRTFAEIEKGFPDEFWKRGADIVHYRVPGGESFDDCRRRVLEAFHEILGASKNIFIAGHAGANRIILCYIMGVPLQKLFKIRQEYGCLSIISGKHRRFAACYDRT
jgi:alpha-ribazole phosphatase